MNFVTARAVSRRGRAGARRPARLSHTFASFGIAAGWNAKTLLTYMWHSSIQVTYDVYGHLFPGSEAEAASLLEAYFASRKTPLRMRRDDAGMWACDDRRRP